MAAAASADAVYDAAADAAVALLRGERIDLDALVSTFTGLMKPAA